MWTAPCELFESTLQKTKKKKKKKEKEIGNFKYKRFMRCQQRPVSAHFVDRDSILIPLYRHLPSHRQSDTQSRRAYDKEVYASFFLRLHFTFSRPQNITIPFCFPKKMSFTCAHFTSFDFLKINEVRWWVMIIHRPLWSVGDVTGLIKVTACARLFSSSKLVHTHSAAG